MKLTKEIIEEFKEVKKEDSFIMSSRYVIKIKRNIELVVTDLDTPNLMICLTQIDKNAKIGEGDVVAVWNYDKDISVEQFKSIYKSLTNKELE